VKTHRVCPPPITARDPGFLRALELDTMVALVQRQLSVGAQLRELHPEYVRWKERDGSLIGYRAVVRQGDTESLTYVTARTAAPHRLADESTRLLHRADEDHAGLRAFAFLPDADLLLLSFPIDRAMGDLRRVVRASKMRNLVAAWCPDLIPEGLRISKGRSCCSIARYKPERRAVLRWDLGLVDANVHETQRVSVWIRCYAEPRASRTRAATTAARAAGVECPTALGIPHERLLLESHVEGQPWQPFASPATTGVAAAAESLASLHGARLPAALPHHGPLAELDLVLRAAEDLERLDPDLGRMALRVADRVSHRVPVASATVLAHGDMHPGQVLLTAEGAGLCDFDRACLAPAALDLANLMAHCIASDPVRGASLARGFCTEYGKFRQLPGAVELGWWNACALVRVAMTPFRSLQSDWPEAALALLLWAEAACAVPADKEAP